MENATKALYIAAGVLIGILILSLGVNLYFIFSQYTKDSQQQMQNNRIATFNSTFLNYDQRQDITIQDVVSVINYALEYNMSYPNYVVGKNSSNPNGTNEYIDVFINNQYILNENTTKLLQEYIEKQEYIDGKRFRCIVELSNTTGRVYKITFYY